MSKESNKRESRPDQQANQSIFSILGLGAKCQVTSASQDSEHNLKYLCDHRLRLRVRVRVIIEQGNNSLKLRPISHFVMLELNL